MIVSFAYRHHSISYSDVNASLDRLLAFEIIRRDWPAKIAPVAGSTPQIHETEVAD